METCDPELDFSTLLRTEGWIKKKGGAVKNSTISRHNWKKRWFELKYVPIRNKPNYQLHYFDQPRGTLKGKVDLLGTEVYSDNGKETGQKQSKHDFQILLNTGKTLQLSCDNLDERDEWLETFNLVLFRLRKANMAVPGLDELLKGYDPFHEDDEDAYSAGEEIAQTIQAFGPGLFGAEAGQQAQFVLQMYDRDGHPVNVGGLSFTATLMDDECLYHIRVVDNDNGTYSAHYVISRPSKYELSIRLNDEHEIFGSPFAVEVVPSRTVPEKCTCEGSCLVEGLPADQTSRFTLYARDQFGNQKQSGGDIFELGVMGPATLHSLTDNGDGTYTCSIDAQNPLNQSQITSASLMITVTLFGKHVLGSPFRPGIIPSLLQSQGRGDTMFSRSSLAKRSVGTSQAPRGNSISQSNGNFTSSNTDKLFSSGAPSPAASGDGFYPPEEQPRYATPGAGRDSTSRLDMARQRAMGGIVSTATAEPATAPSSPAQRSGQAPSPSKTGRADAGADLAQRLSRLEQMTRQVGQGSTAAAAISSANARRGNSMSSKATSRASEAPPPAPTSGTPSSRREDPAWKTMASRVAEDSRVDSTVFMDSMAQGIVGQAPQRSTDEERRLLMVADEALRNKEVIHLLGNAADILNQAFRLFFDVQEEGIALQHGKWGRGIYKLLEEFDILPSYCSKKDVKTIFALVIYAEMPASSARGYMNFHSFVKLLVTLAVFCLSNPPFSALYQTSKVC